MEDLLSQLNVILDHEAVIKEAKTRLSDDEIEAIAIEQLEFLNLLFPFLGHTPFRINYQDRYESLHLELRAMKRFEPVDPKQKGTARYTSFNTFKLDETCVDYLKSYIRQCNRSKFQLCEYFIFSAFDKNIAKNADTEPNMKRPAMCNATNTAMIQSLMLDFDKLSKEEFIEYYTRLRQVGLEGLVVFTGHGYQIHFLLNEPTRDVHALKAFVRLASVMGYPVDGGANTISQLCRMPATWNSKAYDPKFNYELSVIQTEWLIKTDKRYTLDELFLALSENQCIYDESWDALSMDKPVAVNTADEEFRKSEQKKIKEKIKAKVKLENIKKEEKEKKKTEKKKEKEEKVEKRAKNLDKSSSKRSKKDVEVSFMAIDLRELYPTIELEHHSSGVQNLLKGPMEGLANLGLKFLVAYLKSMDYKLSEIIEITKVWQGLDTFDYAWDEPYFVKSETERFFNSNYKVDKGDVPSLEDAYGELFNEDSTYYSLKDKVIFDNDNFCKLREITPTAFLLLCSIKANDLRENTKYYTESDLADLVLRTEKTVRTHMNKLVELGIAKVEKRKPTGEKGGRPAKYYSLTDIDIEEIKYTKVDVSKIEALLFRTFKSKRVKEPLSDRAFMVALYIRYRSFGNRQSCFMKQENMAKEMGISRTRLTNAMTELEKHKLIRKKQHEVFSTLEYVIMY